MEIVSESIAHHELIHLTARTLALRVARFERSHLRALKARVFGGDSDSREACAVLTTGMQYLRLSADEQLHIDQCSRLAPALTLADDSCIANFLRTANPMELSGAPHCFGDCAKAHAAGPVNAFAALGIAQGAEAALAGISPGARREAYQGIDILARRDSRMPLLDVLGPVILASIERELKDNGGRVRTGSSSEQRSALSFQACVTNLDPERDLREARPSDPVRPLR